MIYKSRKTNILGVMAAGLLLFVSSSVAAQGISYTKQGGLHEVTYESGQSFYHFPIRLTPENTRLELVGYKSRYNTAPWSFKDGLFEFYIKKEALPIKTPNCQKYVVVRSPYVPCDKENKGQCQKQRTEREELYNEIGYTLGNGGGINIVLETIPGFTVIKNGEPVLHSCNLYLRTYRNEYIDYTGPLKDTSKQEKM